MVLLLFSVSYTYRLGFDFTITAQSEADPNSDKYNRFAKKQEDQPFVYASVIFFMYIFGELIPLLAIFCFHYRNNKTFEKNYEDSVNPDMTNIERDNGAGTLGLNNQ